MRGTGNAGPHAVRQVAKVAAAGGGVVDFTYDDIGDLTDGDGRHLDFDLMDRPVKVKMGGAETEFSPRGGKRPRSR